MNDFILLFIYLSILKSKPNYLHLPALSKCSIFQPVPSHTGTRHFYILTQSHCHLSNTDIPLPFHRSSTYILIMPEKKNKTKNPVGCLYLTSLARYFTPSLMGAVRLTAFALYSSNGGHFRWGGAGLRSNGLPRMQTAAGSNQNRAFRFSKHHPIHLPKSHGLTSRFFFHRILHSVCRVVSFSFFNFSVFQFL